MELRYKVRLNSDIQKVFRQETYVRIGDKIPYIPKKYIEAMARSIYLLLHHLDGF